MTIQYKLTLFATSLLSTGIIIASDKMEPSVQMSCALAPGDILSFDQDLRLAGGHYNAQQALQDIHKNLIPVNMSDDEKSAILNALGSISANRLTPNFTLVLGTLFSPTMHWYEKTQIINALGTVPPELLTPLFSQTLKSLCTKGMEGYEKENIIKALGKVPPELLIPLFCETLKVLCTEDMHGYGKEAIINALEIVPVERFTPLFSQALKVLCTENMDAYAKERAIHALHRVPPQYVNSELITALEGLSSENTGDFWQLDILNALNIISPKEYQDLCQKIHAVFSHLECNDLKSRIKIARFFCLTPPTLYKALEKFLCDHPDFVTCVSINGYKTLILWIWAQMNVDHDLKILMQLETLAKPETIAEKLYAGGVRSNHASGNAWATLMEIFSIELNNDFHNSIVSIYLKIMHETF
ncbi:MAG: hypothetical protein Q8K36_06755, partial [Alphaproteobacteria bacterium]|nr:hypothetical protein [Alphaproteobacteria bacterium]